MSERKRAEHEGRATQKIVITRSTVRAATRPEAGESRDSCEPDEHRAPVPTLVPPSNPSMPAAARVSLSDIPAILGVSTSHARELDPRVQRLLSAIDGELTVVELAAFVNMDAETARNIFAELEDAGHIVFHRREQQDSDVESILRAGTRTSDPSRESGPESSEVSREARTPDYWLQGLTPRRK